MSRNRFRMLLINSKKNTFNILSDLKETGDEKNDFTFYGLSLNEDKTLYATYSEKLEFHEEAYDQFGNVVDEISYITYRNINFHIETLDTNRMLMVISNPPSTIKNFIRNFSSALDFQIGFSTPEINLKKFKDILELELQSKINGAEKVKVSQLAIDKNARATIEITSIKDAFESLTQLIANKEYKIDKLSTSININNTTVAFEISKFCSLQIHEEHIKKIIPSLKNTLIKQ
ncbi:hypothetical protein [Aeromonas hydrophila]|uniref:hypothetical protein n=1 Tax=Aeromonas hydrophila TaxID=644 RepID=UPI0030172F1C